jgi:hypothetical protein
MNQPLEVKSAVLHASMEFPGLEAGVSLNASKYPDLRMEIRDSFLVLTYKGLTGLIPLANIKFLLLK